MQEKRDPRPPEELANARPGTGFDRRQFIAKAAGGVVSLGAVGGLLAACGDTDSTRPGSTGEAVKPPANKPPSGVLRVANPEAPLRLDSPMITNAAAFAANIYDGVLHWNTDYTELTGGLVSSWKTSDDGLEFELTMRPGATYHDGEPVDAASLATNYRFLVAGRGFSSFLVPAFRKLDASDPTKLKVVLKEPAPDFLRNHTFLRLASPKAIAQGADPLNRHPVGSGPFRFVSRNTSGHVVLEAFEDYWGEGPYLERLEFPVIADPSARIAALRSGDVDLLQTVLPQQLRQLQGGEFKVMEGPSWGGRYLFMVSDHPPFDDVRVRQAVLHAVDREALIAGTLLGKGTPAETLYLPTVPNAVPAEVTYAHDPEKARALLTEAGHPNGVDVAFGTSAVNTQLAEAVAGQLREAGINASVHGLDEGVFGAELGKRKSRYGLWFMDFFWTTGGPLIYSIDALVPGMSHYTGADIMDRQRKYLSTQDGPARQAALSDLEATYAEKALFSPLWVTHNLAVARSEVNGYVPPKDVAFPSHGSVFLSS